MDTKTYYVYIETNKTNKVFYIGVTNNIERRDNQPEKNEFWWDYWKRTKGI